MRTVLVVRLDSAGDVLLAGPAVRAVAAQADRVVLLTSPRGRDAAVLAGAAAVVAGNGGPAHLAAAAGTPVVSLFAPVVPAERWRPWGVPHVLLGAQDAPCAGSRARHCPVPGHPCLDAVTADEVVAAVRQLAGPAAGFRDDAADRTEVSA